MLDLLLRKSILKSGSIMTLTKKKKKLWDLHDSETGRVHVWSILAQRQEAGSCVEQVTFKMQYI